MIKNHQAYLHYYNKDPLFYPNGIIACLPLSISSSFCGSSSSVINTNAQRRLERLKQERASIYELTKARWKNKGDSQLSEKDIHPPGVFGPLVFGPFSRHHGRQQNAAYELLGDKGSISQVTVGIMNMFHRKNYPKSVDVDVWGGLQTTTHPTSTGFVPTIWTQQRLLKARILKIAASSEKGHSLFTKLRLLAFGLLQKTSDAERIVLEDLVTSFLMLLIRLCNALIYRNYKVRLNQDDDNSQSRAQSDQRGVIVQ
jgi:hypothetical protein